MDTKTYGSFWLRLIAYLFDSLLIWLIPVAWFLYLVFSVVDISAFGMGILWLSWYLVIGQWFTWQLYPLITLILFGGSIGKRMAGLKIEKEDGSMTTLNDGLIRFPVGYSVSKLVLGWGFWAILKDNKRQGFHDHFAKTVVVKDGSVWPIFIALPFLIILFIVLLSNTITVGNKRGLWQKIETNLIETAAQIKTQFNETTNPIVPPPSTRYPAIPGTTY